MSMDQDAQDIGTALSGAVDDYLAHCWHVVNWSTVRCCHCGLSRYGQEPIPGHGPYGPTRRIDRTNDPCPIQLIARPK